jgi:hypothetical protein
MSSFKRPVFSHLILESCLAQRREEREFQRETFLSNGGRKGECRTDKQEKHLEIKIKFKKEEKKKKWRLDSEV